MGGAMVTQPHETNGCVLRSSSKSLQFRKSLIRLRGAPLSATGLLDFDLLAISITASTQFSVEAF
jgi:hypothetical protein